MSISANKGEWSELYVLFNLLAEKKIHAGDGALNKLKVFYPVLKIIRDELERRMEYSICKDIVVVTEDGNEVARINTTEFSDESKKLFEMIRLGGDGNGAFEIPSQEDFLRKIHCEKIKAKSKDKADINIVIHDYHTGMQPNLGFSIKSDAGSSPTLLNASTATEFSYRIEGNINDNIAERINLINGRRKIQDRVNAINDYGFKLVFDSVEYGIFNNNLCMIDSYLPDILAWMMADSYQNRDMNIKRAVDRITNANPKGYNLMNGHDFYGYKVKSFMVASALGMLPAKTWNGMYDATGGYIIVKNDGDVICFHIYDRNLLEDYLFQNTKFETPTGKRYNLGKVYKDDRGNYKFNLNLQIRFI